MPEVLLHQILHGSNIILLAYAGLLLTAGWVVSHIVYNIYFHPLSKYPGPKLWAATRIPWNYHSLKGDIIHAIKALHDEHGPVVRVAPDELDYITSTAWKTIYGHRTPEMGKAFDGRGPPPSVNGTPGIIHAPKDVHTRLRRSLLPAFSDRALRDQEEYVQKYANLLVEKLKGYADAGRPADLTVWYNYATFDVIGDLAYGQSFNCLANSAYHPLIEMIFGAVKITPYLNLFIYYRLQGLIKHLVPKKLVKAREETAQYSYDTMEKRLARTDDRRDFVSYILEKNDVDSGLAREEIRSISNELIVAGSDTTSRLLAGCTHLVLTHPRVYRRLVDEVRSAFQNDEDITSVKVNGLEYLIAVLQESLRMYPPSPSTLPRIVPGKGEDIDGQWVPVGTAVGVNQWSASQSSHNFHRAQEFIPERWMDPSQLPSDLSAESASFARDDKAAIQPFSFGPRACLGVNLAKMESRLIMAKMFWHFEMEMEDPEYDWRDQKVFLSWQKNPLLTRLRVVKR